MFKINERIIRQGCGLHKTYKDGYDYYVNNAVLSLERVEDRQTFIAEVVGTYIYEVVIGFDSNGELDYTDCDCPAHAKYPGYCKHVVAVLFEILERQPPVAASSLGKDSRELAREMLSLLDYHDPESSQELNLDITLHRRRDSLALSMKIGVEKMYVLKDFREFFTAMNTGQVLYYGKHFTYEPDRHQFSAGDTAVVELLREVYSMDNYLARGVYGRARLVEKKEIILPEAMLGKVLKLLEGRRFNLDTGQRYLTDVELVHEDIPLDFSLSNKDGSLSLAVNPGGELEFLDGDLQHAVYNGKVHKLSPRQSRALQPVQYGLKHSKDSRILLPREYREQFVSVMLPALKRAGAVKIDPGLEEDFYHCPLLAKVWLDGSGDAVSAKVEFNYGQYSLNPFAPQPPDTGDKILVRDMEGERNLMDLLERAGFTVRGDGLHLEGEDKVFELFFEVAPRLQEQADIFYSDRLGRTAAVSRPVPRGRVSMTAGNLLEVDFELEGVDKKELAGVLMSLREKRKYHRLKDGSLLALDHGELDNLAGMLEELDLKKGDLARGNVQVPAYRALAMDHFLNDDALHSFRRDRSFRELVAKIMETDDTEFVLPPELEPVLRDYQKRGFRWLKSLAACNMGGILADEMGLGKTLEVIALLKSELPLQAPALVVAPTSLLYNWQAEIQRFSPDLRVALIAGTREERLQRLHNLDVDVAVTSYALIRRDIEDYQDVNFSWCILDEAQYIKNPASQTARAVKDVQASRQLALTGTPIENSLSELWSVFDFLMPGFLSGHTKFMQKYAKPIQDGNSDRARELSRKIAPFVLRRLKKDVLKELPPKIEHKMLSELTREQKTIYLAWLEKIRGEAAAAMAQEGFDRSRVKILAGLTRLRQICCHPSLFLENYPGGSGKLDQLREVAADSVASGHRLLIFSQFTTMLKMIRQQLTADGLDCFYLDGSTPAEKRLEYVHAFNRGEKNVFLISLKAGGTGLNLVGADTVIHYDLWWNPAVEDQASDRAHRIGQTRRVQVMKFVALGTIDEKIYELQQKKKELIDKVIDPGETLLTSLTEEELRGVLGI